MRTQIKPRACRSALLLAATIVAVSLGAISAAQNNDAPSGAPTLEETRLKMGKWIETQQIISKERNEWHQGKEILLGRLELVKKEIATLEEKIAQAQASVDQSNKKRDELMAENDQLKAVDGQLIEAVTGMEVEVRRLFKALPEPITTKLEPLSQRMPEDPTNTRASAAERFQNVLGILNELNKTNNEIEFTGISLKRLVDAIGGMRFPGVGVDLEGAVAEGQFAIIGPVALFCSKSGAAAGLAIPQTGSTKPLIRPLEARCKPAS